VITEHAAAKVNLALHVTGHRDDGYHLIETVAVFCDIGDTLRLAPADRDRFDMSGPFAHGLDGHSDNLVLRARDRLRERLETGGRTAPPVALHLEKNLPVASGIGGGSADAAAALRGLARLWGADQVTLLDVAAGLGADVPMCLVGRPLLASGIGETLTPLAGWPELHLVLANPGAAVSTPEVFRRLAGKRNPALPDISGLSGAVAIADYLATTRNDLEAPALSLVPEISMVLAELRDAGVGTARMSGSGATCFGLCPTREIAEDVATTLQSRHPGWYLTATTTFAADEEHDMRNQP
jgi:4-diphosphocytidyl-2-C-methyl-D-erythritol kinase